MQRHGAAAVCLVLGATLATSCGQGEDGLAGTPTSAAPHMSATEAATPAKPSRPPHSLLERGEAVPAVEGTGVLLLDPATGGGELWDFSEGGRFIATADRGYRYIVYGPADEPTLLDATTGGEWPARYNDDPLWMTKIGPGGEVAVGQAGEVTGVFSLPGLEPIALLEAPGRNRESSRVESVEWSADGGALAIIRTEGASRVLDVVVGDVARALGGAPGQAMQWSWDGSRVAVTGAGGLAIYGAADGRVLRRDVSGRNPRWSPDDRYLAVAHPGNLDAVRIFESDSGAEVLRVTGAPYCLGDYWYDDGTVAGGGPWPSSTGVPGGVVGARPAADLPGVGTSLPFAARGVSQDGDALRLTDQNGAVLAQVRLVRGTYWSWPSTQDGVQGVTSDGRGVVLLGVGGRGLCDAGRPAPAVYRPPFSTQGWEFAEQGE